MLFLVAAAAVAATMLGGLFALRLRDKLHLILGLSAGAVVAVAFFDLIPEALTLSTPVYAQEAALTLIGVGFLAYLALDRFFFMHAHAEGDAHAHRGSAGAGALSVHSFLDGIGIGLAFQVSPAVGLVVAVA